MARTLRPPPGRTHRMNVKSKLKSATPSALWVLCRVVHLVLWALAMSVLVPFAIDLSISLATDWAEFCGVAADWTLSRLFLVVGPPMVMFSVLIAHALRSLGLLIWDTLLDRARSFHGWLVDSLIGKTGECHGC